MGHLSYSCTGLAAGIKADRVGGDPDDAAIFVEKADGIESKTRKMTAAGIAIAEKFAGVPHVRVPAAAKSYDRAVGNTAMAVFPSLEITPARCASTVGRGRPDYGGFGLFRSRRLHLRQRYFIPDFDKSLARI